jgi:hypothetical protein
MAKNVTSDKVNSHSNSGNARSDLKVIKTVRTLERDGFIVNRAFHTHFLSVFDPFLLLDEMGPADYGLRQARGLQIIRI